MLVASIHFFKGSKTRRQEKKRKKMTYISSTSLWSLCYNILKGLGAFGGVVWTAFRYHGTRARVGVPVYQGTSWYGGAVWPRLKKAFLDKTEKVSSVNKNSFLTPFSSCSVPPDTCHVISLNDLTRERREKTVGRGGEGAIRSRSGKQQLHEEGKRLLF